MACKLRVTCWDQWQSLPVADGRSVMQHSYMGTRVWRIQPLSRRSDLVRQAQSPVHVDPCSYDTLLWLQ